MLGRAYWRAIQPFHALTFPRMARNILAAAEQLEAEELQAEELEPEGRASDGRETGVRDDEGRGTGS